VLSLGGTAKQEHHTSHTSLTSGQFHITSVHTRMPAILHPRDYGRWLDREVERPPIDLLRPFESGLMAAVPCNPLVGNVKNNGPEMLNSA
jgi:putative SOS response-associated peptidase YedK